MATYHLKYLSKHRGDNYVSEPNYLIGRGRRRREFHSKAEAKDAQAFELEYSNEFTKIEKAPRPLC